MVRTVADKFTPDPTLRRLLTWRFNASVVAASFVAANDVAF